MQHHDGALFRAAALPVGVVTAVIAVVAGIQMGGGGVVGAVLGGAVVIAFFGADHALSARTRRTEPVAVMGLVLLGYLLKITLLALFLVLLRDTESFSTGTLAASLLVGTVVWLVAAVRAFARRRILSVDPGPGPGARP